MQFSFVDFLIGFTLMNAMPHFLFGLRSDGRNEK
jgi:hypothetical protein